MTSTEDRGQQDGPAILIVGASRGLGEAMAGAFLQLGWRVTGTVRGTGRSRLQDLADAHADRLSVETLDITQPETIAALRRRLSGRGFDILFVNAGTANENPAETIAETSTEEFVRVMLTNTLGVMRAVEGLADLVRASGLIGVMSSGQGSIGNNTTGDREVYRSSKAALNQCMRSYAARQAQGGPALLLLAPGWIRTDLGGPEAPFGLEETVPQIVDTIVAQQGKSGLQFLDRFGRTVPW